MTARQILCIAQCVLLSAIGVAQGALAEQVFGLAGKRSDDANFQAAWRGCDEEARRQGDRCLHIGQPGAARARIQDESIQAALRSGLAGLAVSVTHTAYLAENALAQARRAGVPVVTFDSDLEAAHRGLRRAYIGPDNEAFGRELGALLLQQRGQGGTVCLMSADAHDPNLNERLQGVRRALGIRAGGARLHGEGGWTEPARCPWFNGDQPERARRQVQLALADMAVDAVVSVGAWPLVEPELYEQMIQDIARQRPRAGQAVLVGAGMLSARQALLLQRGVLGGVVEIDFEAMGRAAYLAMKRLSQGQPVEGLIRTGFNVRSAERTEVR